MNDGVEVTSVAGYCAHIVSAYGKSVHTRVSDVSAITFYRGQANQEWLLSPRLYRDDLFHSERALIQEIIRLCPREFEGMNDIDRLVKMQHYGLPTRLIDMTTNPLVALFFACWDRSERKFDGRVYVFPSLPVFRPHNREISIVAHYITNMSDSEVDMSEVLERLRRGGLIAQSIDNKDAESLIESTIEIPFHALIPNATNDRLRIQDGAFLLPGMVGPPASQVRRGSRIVNSKRFEPRMLGPTLGQIWRSAFTVRIPASAKHQLLGELSLLGVSRGKLFPELEHQTTYVTELIQSGGSMGSAHN